jgi:hypothetical protein
MGTPGEDHTNISFIKINKVFCVPKLIYKRKLQNQIPHIQNSLSRKSTFLTGFWFSSTYARLMPGMKNGVEIWKRARL